MARSGLANQGFEPANSDRDTAASDGSAECFKLARLPHPALDPSLQNCLQECRDLHNARRYHRVRRSPIRWQLPMEMETTSLRTDGRSTPGASASRCELQADRYPCLALTHASKNALTSLQVRSRSGPFEPSQQNQWLLPAQRCSSSSASLLLGIAVGA